MHETKSPNFIGYIDNFNRTGDHIRVAGWLVPKVNKEHVDMHLEYGVDIIFYAYNVRPDVAQFYNTQDINYQKSGFDITVPYKGQDTCTVYALVNGVREDIFLLDLNKKDNTQQVFHDVPSQLVQEPELLSVRHNIVPEIIVVDNFYDDPDLVRELALKQEFNPDLRYHKGRRTSKKFFPVQCKQIFEGLLGRRITNWIDYEYNGVFQFCTAEDPLVYHSDTQSYAAAIYLTPDAPLESGTTFYRSRRHPEIRKINLDSPLYNNVFKHGFYDKTQFETVDIVGNVYNRLAIWDSRIIHSASQYFGNNLENSRLFHLFFFDIEET